MKIEALKITNLEDAIKIIHFLIQKVDAQSAEITLLIAKNKELEEKLKTNSQNSSKPPSQDPFRKKKKNHPKKKSIDRQKITGKKNKTKKNRKLSIKASDISTSQDLFPCDMCDCGGIVEQQLKVSRKSYQYEIPKVKPIITEFSFHNGRCCSCGKVHHASLPEGVPNGILGPHAMSMIAEYIGVFHLSRREVKAILEKNYSIPVSLGTISNSEKTLSAALKPAVEEAKQRVQQQPVVYMDETSHKQSGIKNWLWVCVTKNITTFSISVSRGMKVAKEILGDSFKGYLVTDRYSSYNWVAKEQRQLCWAHLIRDFIRMSERSGNSERIAMQILAYVRRMFSLWHLVREKSLTHKRFQDAMIFIRRAIEFLLGDGVKRGDKKTSASCKMILKLKESLWNFVDHLEIEPTNNVSERNLRPFVIWRKKSFGSQSIRGNHFIERVLTVAMSCKQQSRNFSEFVELALWSHFAQVSSPSLIP